jgi:hypothetical protein
MLSASVTATLSFKKRQTIPLSHIMAHAMVHNLAQIMLQVTAAAFDTQ